VFILYILLLHVSALVGHLQVEYTIILGSYFTHKTSNNLDKIRATDAKPQNKNTGTVR
jgi:hypothetical protein